MVKLTWLPLPCVLETALAFINPVARPILCSKGSGHLLLLSYPVYFACLLSFCCLNPKIPKYLSFSVCRPFLIQGHLSIPSAPRGIDILIYRKATIDPLDLWVIKNLLLARLTGEASQLNLSTSPPSSSWARPTG